MDVDVDVEIDKGLHQEDQCMLDVSLEGLDMIVISLEIMVGLTAETHPLGELSQEINKRISVMDRKLLAMF